MEYLKSDEIIKAKNEKIEIIYEKLVGVSNLEVYPT